MASQPKIIWQEFRRRPLGRKIFDILLVLLALTGLSVVGAWAIFELGLTNNRGSKDRNHRQMAGVSEYSVSAHNHTSTSDSSILWAKQYARLSLLAEHYPHNARLMAESMEQSRNPLLAERMLAAARIYLTDNKEYIRQDNLLIQKSWTDVTPSSENLVPWMNSDLWHRIRQAIANDSALIIEAGRLTGVEPRLIVGCLIVEQMRLSSSNREKIKQNLGPVKALGVQSQFSYGVNGIKEKTAIEVEEHLKDPSSPFYMGVQYEHLLDFTTDDHITERYNRLVDYRNHLYSYLYTGCILHQTMLQWQRAGFDISDRPEILFTLFNLGFSRSKPNANPQAGGSTIRIEGQDYSFSGIGFDFYYSGELALPFPIYPQHFFLNSQNLSKDDIARIQSNVSDCRRPQRGLEWRGKAADSVSDNEDELENPFGILPDDRIYTPVIRY